MPKKKDDGTSAARWFSRVNEVCFDKKMPTTQLLYLFMVPMCAPNNNNYGRKKSEIKSGRASHSEQKPADVIAREQWELLNTWIDCLEDYSLDGEGELDRAKNLANDLTRRMKTWETNFCRKPDNITEQRYLSIFCNAYCLEVKTEKDVFTRVVDFYERIVTLIYADTPAVQLRKKADAFAKEMTEQHPEMMIPEQASLHRELAWLICAYLTLAAAKKKPDDDTNMLVGRMLEIDDFSQCPDVASPPPGDRMTVSRMAIRLMCEEALQSDTTPAKIVNLYSALMEIYGSDRIPADLLELFCGNLNGKIERLHSSLQTSLQSSLNGGTEITGEEFAERSREVYSLMKLREDVKAKLAKLQSV